MKNYQILNINHNSLSFNNEKPNLKSSNQSIVIEDNKKIILNILIGFEFLVHLELF